MPPSSGTLTWTCATGLGSSAIGRSPFDRLSQTALPGVGAARAIKRGSRADSLAPGAGSIGGRHPSPGVDRRPSMIDLPDVLPASATPRSAAPQGLPDRRRAAALPPDGRQVDLRNSPMSGDQAPAAQQTRRLQRPDRALLERHPYTAQQILQQLKAAGLHRRLQHPQGVCPPGAPGAQTRFSDARLCSGGMRPGGLGQLRFRHAWAPPAGGSPSSSWCCATAA